MNLVLVGNHSLDELERLAKFHFHDVFNNKTEANDYSNEISFTKEHSWQKIFKIIPSKDIRTLTLKW